MIYDKGLLGKEFRQKIDLQNIALELLKREDLVLMNTAPRVNAWSALACLEHLKMYNNFYLPQIREAISQSPFGNYSSFTPGILGGYLAKKIQPKSKLNSMKAMAAMSPRSGALSIDLVEQIREDNESWISLVEASFDKDWNKIKIPTAISPLLKLRLGDTFMFNFNHQERHFLQIKNTLEQIKSMN